jgi:hypothetical protein
MIKSFPEFTKITIDLKQEISDYTKKYELYSDFSFANLFSWNTDDKAGVSWLNGNLVVKLPDYVYGGEHLYSILGHQKIDESVAEILKIAGRLDLVPEVVIGHMENPEIYAIAEDRDSFDYVYYVDKLRELNGSKLKNKRQKVQHTKNDLGDRLTFENIKKLNKALQIEMLEVLNKWQSQTPQPADHTRLEQIAINRLFDHIDHFELHTTTARIDGKLAGFTIHESIDDENYICHFEKAILDEHDGIYAVLINEAAKSLDNSGQKNVNWEQDLGIPGLKHIKRSYAPYKFQKKYWVSTGS